mgnify:FL=1
MLNKMNKRGHIPTILLFIAGIILILVAWFGFLGFDNDERVGQYGVEEFYEKDLRGEMESIVADKDAFGRIMGMANKFINPQTPAKDLILTIDRNVQFMAEEKLRWLVDKWDADSGSMIVMDPSTGDIMALVNFPDFNLNEYFEVEDIEDEKYNVKEQTDLFIENKGQMLACGTCLESRQKEASNVCPISTMKDLLQIVEESDKVLTFG